MTPLERYHIDLRNSEFLSDPAQEMAVEQTQLLYDRLLAEHAGPSSLLNRTKRRMFGYKKWLFSRICGLTRKTFE